ncbi:hypothetical protein MCUN1_002905 [Malassezia cuniculi]|uniref:F-box domain-containing protein n=1 Tax=Malassezia cuniculi TaxID=948313 RepID=A0AAF0EWW8_9BASI|nr:hypothetical protein MCUN1_002905 [Malassezia cuniculi]
MHELRALPVEVLERVAYEAVRTDTGPPAGLTSLLLVSRHVHDTLAGSILYARLFCSSFDTDAIARRFGLLERSTAAAELVKRFRALHAVRSGDYTVEHLWTIYLIALEDDGRNIRQLEWANTAAVLESHADTGVAPSETEEAALALGIRAILSGGDRGTLQIAFGAHAYKILLAPESRGDDDSETHAATAADAGAGAGVTDASNSAAAASRPRQRAIDTCGQRISLAVPPAALGAISLFCESESAALGFPMKEPARSSLACDADYYRLLKCTSPTAPGLSADLLGGMLAGVWEGTFFFLDFDAYRDMLAGHPVRQAYAGQRQLLRLKETGQDDTHITLSGSGHSAWGRFTVSGSVRIWDGLVTVHKTYVSRREAWTYQGYVLGRHRIVGRWRDVAPGAQTGYEGPFVLSRR